MTIALGILANDGLVVAEDTQLTVPGFLKMSQGKVSWNGRYSAMTRKKGQLVISGAGAETSIKHLRQNLMNRFTEGDAVMSVTEIGEELKKQVADYHANYVTPHARDGSLDVWMIVGALEDSNARLWSTDKSVVNDESPFGAVGIGALQARIVMGQMFAPMNTLGAILLAAYVVWRVKKTIEDVGEDTDIVGVRSDKTYWVERRIVKRVEEIFTEYRTLSAQVLHGIFGDNMGWPNVPKRSPSSEIRRLRREVGEVIKELERLPAWAISGQLSSPSSSESSQT